jgi:hypothetical protein
MFHLVQQENLLESIKRRGRLKLIYPIRFEASD